jgi:Putative Actinobacterial Holin-X, holin superfamily III
MLKPADPSPIKEGEEPPIGDLLGRLIDDAEAYGRAELNVAKARVEAKADALKLPSILIAASLFFAQSALTVLAVGVALALAPFVGPLAASFIAFLVFGGIAAALVWSGWTRFREEL